MRISFNEIESSQAVRLEADRATEDILIGFSVPRQAVVAVISMLEIVDVLP